MTPSGVSNSVETLNVPQKEAISSPLNIKKYFLVAAYFASIPFLVIFLILTSLFFKYGKEGYIARQTHQLRYQALPETTEKSSVSLGVEDGRIQNLDEFFAKYNSPLEGHATTIVEEADKHNIDYRLLPAIAMQESTLCKKIIEDSHNCWGFGIYGSKVTKFDSYEAAIKRITETMAKKYVHNGYTSISQIVRKYTPSDTGRWEQTVSMIMSQLHESL